MSLRPIELNTLSDLYSFIEGCARRTGLILDSQAMHRPWARSVSGDVSEVDWVYPSKPLIAEYLQHLSNFAHRNVSEKGFLLIQMGTILAAVDVDAVNGSAQPMKLAEAVRRVFRPKRAQSEQRAQETSVSQPPPPEIDPFLVLGAEDNDDEREIRKKYKKMLMQYHPDRVSHLGPELRELAARKTLEINQAFEKIRRMRRF